MANPAPKLTKSKTPQQLSTKQQRFVDFYDGNATQAAEKAGYSHPGSQGQRLLKNVAIKKAIRKRQDIEAEPNIKSRRDRQVFWSKMIDTAEKDSDKLKASELLGRSEADFTDKQEVTHKGQIAAHVYGYLDKESNDSKGK